MRKAKSLWEDDYTRKLTTDGFSAPTILFHPERQVRIVVHGDDATFAGTELEFYSGIVDDCTQGSKPKNRQVDSAGNHRAFIFRM